MQQERFLVDLTREKVRHLRMLSLHRVIDRPMRPLFPKDYRNDVTLENLVLSVDENCRPELLL